jgi:Bardet-Biedl syndrome 2 protein
VQFTLAERVPRLVMWMDGAFAIDFSTLVADSLDVVFTSLRTGDTLRVAVAATPEGTEVSVYTESMSLAAAVVQDMCEFLKVTELTSQASFARETAALAASLEQVDGYNKARTTLSVTMAESVQHLKGTMLRAEDARFRVDVSEMRREYRNLAEVNRGLISEYSIRAANHKELLACLQSVNTVIQAASGLRMGSAKVETVSAARAAVKSGNFQALERVIATGRA